jgi:hypothetical protein
MIRGAVPLVPTPPACSESPETPSKKRRREIVASDSSFDSISPQRYSNSTSRPPLKRLCTTPLSGSRRRSAPNRLLNSPAKAEIPRQMQMQDYVDVDRVVFKKEKTVCCSCSSPRKTTLTLLEFFPCLADMWTRQIALKIPG